jgi:hypothetical protein
MNKTTAALVAIILVLAACFAWYAAEHPTRVPAIAEGGSAPAGGPDTALAAPRTLSLELAAADIDTAALDIGVGEAHVSASGDDKVHVQVTLHQKERELMWFFHWRSKGTAREIAAASLRQQVQDKRVTLSLDSHGAELDDVKQDWEVQVPARLALKTVMKVGDLSIEDVAGGVDAGLNVGELSIDTPKGRIHAELNVGEIRATSGSQAHGHIDLSSNIGEAVLVSSGKSTGSHDRGGLGNRVTLDGEGADEMRLSVNVGEVSLHLLAPGEEKPKHARGAKSKDKDKDDDE